MNGSGFDWLNIPAANNSGSRSPPPPPVSFGSSNSNSDFTETNPNNINNNKAEHNSPYNNRPHFNGTTNNNYLFANSSADHLPHSHSYTYQNQNQTQDQNPHANFTQSQNSPDINPSTTHGASDESSIPLSLTAQELTLEESKTYMRWYSDILVKTNSRTVSMNDVYQFLNNFKLPPGSKEKLNKIFHKILRSINIGEFFALLRLVSHILNGLEPSRRLIKVKAPVPTPPSILSKKRQNDDNDDGYDDNDAHGTTEQQSAIEEKKPLDLDSFTQFMLTGQRPGESTPSKKKKSKKLKSVKFSDQIVTDIRTSANSPIPSPDPTSQSALDYSLPMDQLLSTLSNQPQPQRGASTGPQGQPAIDRVTSPDEEEREILKDMEFQINHFQNLNSVDTASIDGVPSSINPHRGASNQYLKPNMTGPNQMSQYYSPSSNTDDNSQYSPQLLKPNMTGPAQMSQYLSSSHANPNDSTDNSADQDAPAPLRPNVTGPIDMAKLFAPTSPEKNENHPKITLSAFTDQMTGNTMNNTLQNARVTDNGSPSGPPNTEGGYNNNNRPLPPPPVPNIRRTRSVSTPTPRVSSPLSNNGKPPPQFNGDAHKNHAPPVPPPRLGSPSNERPVPPPPPPSRRRGGSIRTSSPAPPLPPKVAIDSNGNNSSPTPTPTTSQPQSQMPIPQNISDPGNSNNPYPNQAKNDSTANILDDLKALQEEVDKIRSLTGGF